MPSVERAAIKAILLAAAVTSSHSTASKEDTAEAIERE